MRGFILALLLVFPSLASAQMVPVPVLVPERVVSYSFLSEAWGFTFCYEGRAIAFVMTGLTDDERAEVTAHEERHRRQYERLGSCEEVDRFTGTFAGRVLLETEAYAVGMCVAIANGGDRIYLRRKFVQIIANRVAKGAMSAIEVTSLLWKYEQQECPEKV